MTLSSVNIGAPFTIGPRLFYKLYPRFPAVRNGHIMYQCYEVVKGCLQTPPIMIDENTEVKPYIFNKNGKK